MTVDHRLLHVEIIFINVLFSKRIRKKTEHGKYILELIVTKFEAKKKQVIA